MKYLLSMIIGAMVGATFALLYAPSSGEELRAKIKTEAEADYQKLQAELQKGMQEMQSRLDKMGSDLQAMRSRTKETSEPEQAM